MRKIIVLFALALPLTLALIADPIPVRHAQGLVRGFLTVRGEDGKVLGHGELFQAAHGDRVTAHLVYRFRDGSVDDETSTFLQRGTFRLVRDHHIQRGPVFSKPLDITIDAPSGDITSRTTDKDGKEKIEVEHKDLPPDLANGMILAILLNVAPDSPEFKVGMVLPSGKGRLAKLAIAPESTGVFTATGVRYKATIFRIKIDLGGIAGVVAPILGKQPPETTVWVVEGEAPGFIRQVGQLAEGGPVVSIELAGTSFNR